MTPVLHQTKPTFLLLIFFFNSTDTARWFCLHLSLGADSRYCQHSSGKDTVFFSTGSSSSMGGSQPPSITTTKPRKHCTVGACYLHNTNQHPTIQSISLQSGNLPSPSCTLFSPTFNCVWLPPTQPLPPLIPSHALSFTPGTQYLHGVSPSLCSFSHLPTAPTSKKICGKGGHLTS